MHVQKSEDPEREAVREKFREVGYFSMPDREREFLAMLRAAAEKHLGRQVGTDEVMTVIADIAGVMAGWRRIVKYNVCYPYLGEKMSAGQYSTHDEARITLQSVARAYPGAWIEPVVVCEGLPEFRPLG